MPGREYDRLRLVALEEIGVLLCVGLDGLVFLLLDRLQFAFEALEQLLPRGLLLKFRQLFVDADNCASAIPGRCVAVILPAVGRRTAVARRGFWGTTCRRRGRGVSVTSAMDAS